MSVKKLTSGQPQMTCASAQQQHSSSGHAATHGRAARAPRQCMPVPQAHRDGAAVRHTIAVQSGEAREDRDDRK